MYVKVQYVHVHCEKMRFCENCFPARTRFSNLDKLITLETTSLRRRRRLVVATQLMSR